MLNVDLISGLSMTLTDIDNMIPFEREIYLAIYMDKLEREDG